MLTAAEGLHEPRIVKLTIYNLSREPIRSEDWDIPPTITFPQGRVVDVVTSTNSADFDAKADMIDLHTVQLRHLL